MGTSATGWQAVSFITAGHSATDGACFKGHGNNEVHLSACLLLSPHCRPLTSVIWMLRPKDRDPTCQTQHDRHNLCVCVCVQGRVTIQAPAAIRGLNKPGEGPNPLQMLCK